MSCALLICDFVLDIGGNRQQGNTTTVTERNELSTSHSATPAGDHDQLNNPLTEKGAASLGMQATLETEPAVDSIEAGVEIARSDQTEPYSGGRVPTMQQFHHMKGSGETSTASGVTHVTSVSTVRGPAELEEGNSRETCYVGGGDGTVLLGDSDEPLDHRRMTSGYTQQQARKPPEQQQQKAQLLPPQQQQQYKPQIPPRPQQHNRQLPPQPQQQQQQQKHKRQLPPQPHQQQEQQQPYQQQQLPPPQQKLNNQQQQLPSQQQNEELSPPQQQHRQQEPPASPQQQQHPLPSQHHDHQRPLSSQQQKQMSPPQRQQHYHQQQPPAPQQQKPPSRHQQQYLPSPPEQQVSNQQQQLPPLHQQQKNKEAIQKSTRTEGGQPYYVPQIVQTSSNDDANVNSQVSQDNQTGEHPSQLAIQTQNEAKQIQVRLYVWSSRNLFLALETMIINGN